MEKIKVIHPITRLIVGGAQQNTIDTCTYLSREMYDTEIIVGPQTGPEGELLSEAGRRGVRLHVIHELVREISPARDAAALMKMVSYFRAQKPRIVHTHSSKAGILGRWAARIAGVPVIVHTVHGWGYHEYQPAHIRLLYQYLERITARITDKMIVVSDCNAEKGLSDAIGSRDLYTTIHSSIDIDAFSPEKYDPVRIRRSFGFSAHAPVIGMVGRLSSQKNPADFVRAAALVKQKKPEAAFLFVGDGPLRSGIERQITQCGLEGSVVLAGLRDDVPALLACMDVFILTSLWEGLPRVIVQAMAAGVPVVANGVDGVREIIRNGTNGFMVDPGDTASMADRVISLLECPDLRASVTRQAHATVRQEFSLWSMIGRIEEIYGELLQEKKII